MVFVEFFGIPRQRAGVASATVSVDQPACLADVLDDLSRQFPEFGRTCLAENRLAAGTSANLDGEHFVADPQTPIRDGQSLLIMSADAGG